MHMRSPFVGLVLLIVGLIAASVHPVVGQTVEVQNGSTLQVENSAVVDLEGGTMNLGGAGATASLVEQSAGRVTGGTLTATRALSSPTDADPAGLGAVLTAGVNLGNVTVTRGHTVQIGGGNASIARYYEISSSQNNSGLDATLTFTYHDDELNGRAESDLGLFRSDDGGTTWTQEGADGRTTSPTGGNTVTLGGIASFSRWTLGSSSDPLPVEMASFEGRATEEGVRLTWQTAAEQNNAGFRVLRTGERENGSAGEWTEVGFVESKAEGGTTSEAQRYRFTDDDLPYAADSVRYRLKQEDIDGTTHLTDPVTIARGGPDGLELLGPAPNPVRQRATVRYGVPESIDGTVQMRLYDVMGRRVRSVEAGAEAGRHAQTLDVDGLSSGVYFLRLQAAGQARTRKLMVMR